MNVKLRLDQKMRLIGTNSLGLETYFDTHIDSGGDDSAPTPMEILLEAVGACSSLDILSILRKKKKNIVSFNVEIDGTRSDEHPKVFTEANIKYILESPDAELNDLQRAADLSLTKYCSVSAMFKNSGCKVNWECQIK